MERDQVKAWMCPRGEHVMGHVVRNGSGIRRLVLYREAVDLKTTEVVTTGVATGKEPIVTEGEVTLKEVDVIGEVEGVGTWRCSICGALRTWVPGEEAIRRLVEGVKKRRLENGDKGRRLSFSTGEGGE